MIQALFFSQDKNNLEGEEENMHKNYHKSIKCLWTAGILAGLLGASSVLAQGDFDDVTIETVPVSDGIYMLVGQGGNIGLSVGDDGAFIIDDQFAPLSEKIKAAIAGQTDQPVRFVVNTHWHGDHVGGNEPFGNDGAVIFAHENVRARLAAGRPAMGGQQAIPPAPEAALPVVTFADGVTFYWNGQTIQVTHVAPSHTDGDSIIHFREANVIHTGDSYINSGYPFIDTSSGGRIEGFISNTKKLLSMVDNDTRIIPGHGPVAGREDVEEFLNVLQLSRDRIGALKQQGKSLEEIQAARPMAEYDKEWGAGFINPDRWIEGVYNTM